MKKCYVCGEPLTAIKDKSYEYSESGLNVTLIGVTQYYCKNCGEESAVIPSIEKLNKAIGIYICRNNKALLLPKEIKFLRKELRLKSKEMAKILGVTESTVSRWENEKSQIGEAQDRLLRSIFLSCTVEHGPHGIPCAGYLNLFKNLPAHRKEMKTPHVLELNPQDWMIQDFACTA